MKQMTNPLSQNSKEDGEIGKESLLTANTSFAPPILAGLREVDCQPMVMHLPVQTLHKLRRWR